MGLVRKTVGFGVREGLQWIRNGCGLQTDEFSVHFEPSESIFDEFHDFRSFSWAFNDFHDFATCRNLSELDESGELFCKRSMQTCQLNIQKPHSQHNRNKTYLRTAGWMPEAHSKMLDWRTWTSEQPGRIAADSVEKPSTICS